jgi:dephospho-CoA kinase
VLRVGLTGGIGAGKTVAADRFGELGATVIDSDVISRSLLASGGAAVDAVLSEFGAQLRLPDGSVDRTALADLVFHDEGARRRLNRIVHPLVAQRSGDILATLPDDAVVVQDIPLLVEAGLEGAFDVVVVVDAPDEARLRRLVHDRGMDEADARARMAAQASREERLDVADYVLVNDGDLVGLRRQVDAVWSDLVGA